MCITRKQILIYTSTGNLFLQTIGNGEHLKTLVSRAYDICSTEKYLKEELNHIETVFKHQNSYPSWVIDKVFKQVQQAQQVPSNTVNEKENDNQKIHRLLLPYRGDKGCNIKKSMNKCVNRLLPNNTKIEVAFKSANLSSCFKLSSCLWHAPVIQLLWRLNFGTVWVRYQLGVTVL